MMIKNPKRAFLTKSAALLAFPWASSAMAQKLSYPERPIRIVVGYPPGQTVDGAARAATEPLAEILGQSVYIDNKAGANGILGAQDVKQAPADGYTLLFGTSGQLAINPSLYKKLPYDPLKDFTPIALNGIGRLYVVVPTTSPFNTLGDLIKYAKANPGKLTYGSGGRGITANLAMEMLKHDAGLDILHVPYKGSANALTDLIGGRIDVMMDAGGLMLPQVEQGRLKALAVASKDRYEGLPNVPTVAEQGYPGFEVAAWTAVMAPANTPRAIVDKLNAAMVRAQKHPSVIRSAKASGSELRVGTPQQMEAFLLAETKKWAKAAKAAGIEPE